MRLSLLVIKIKPIQRMKGQDVLFSHDVQTYSTPPYVFDYFDKVYHFTIDACADKSNHKCKRYFTEEQNGLIQSWKDEIVWINPPYKFTKEWVSKAYNEVRSNNCKVAGLLIPARTDTRLWHEIISPYATTILFIKGRLKFSGHKNSATFPSAFIVFDRENCNQTIRFISILE